MITNALSVDVEEYYHAEIFRRGLNGNHHQSFESRVERSTDRLLELMRAHGARATFFVLGEIADCHPALLRRLAAERHEIACHSHRHDNVWGQSPDEFRADIRRAKRSIEDAAGQAVFKARVERVPVATVVRTRQGKPITNLRRDDFQLFDNGKPRKITDFQSDPSPISLLLLVDLSGSMGLNGRWNSTLDIAGQLELFLKPRRKETEDYITGRFG